MEVEVPQNTIFKAYLMHCRGPTGFAVKEAREVVS
jgi:hypothetical protein